MVKGKSVEYALSVTKDQVVKKLGGLPAVKYHCSVLAVDALKNAIKNYKDEAEGKVRR
jgi:nitrogen fixation NifU-like protein